MRRLLSAAAPTSSHPWISAFSAAARRSTAGCASFSDGEASWPCSPTLEVFSDGSRRHGDGILAADQAAYGAAAPKRCVDARILGAVAVDQIQNPPALLVRERPSRTDGTSGFNRQAKRRCRRRRKPSTNDRPPLARPPITWQGRPGRTAVRSRESLEHVALRTPRRATRERQIRQESWQPAPFSVHSTPRTA